MQKIIREMRGIPYFLLKEYLQEMGGILVNEDLVSGQGWRVQLDRMEPFRLGSLSVGQTRLTMDLEDDVAESFLAQFGKKTLRAGG
jgi:hypothetical protein